jgi:hypothetical protein
MMAPFRIAQSTSSELFVADQKSMKRKSPLLDHVNINQPLIPTPFNLFSPETPAGGR